MSQRSSVRVPPRAPPSSSGVQPNSPDGASPGGGPRGLAPYVRQPLDPEVEACGHDFAYPGQFGQFGPVDFYDDADGGYDGYDGPDADPPAPPPPTRSASPSPSPSGASRQSRAHVGADEDDDDGCDDYDGCKGRSGRKAVEGYRDAGAPASPGAPGSVDTATLCADMGLYVVSGVILIFLLEQFVQIGVKLRV